MEKGQKQQYTYYYINNNQQVIKSAVQKLFSHIKQTSKFSAALPWI